MYTKRQLNDSNKLNFILIGDPALKFAYPEYKARGDGCEWRSCF